MSEYIHGFSKEEQERLIYQNDVISKYIYQNMSFNGSTHVLEIGCGVGAQMIYLLKRFPNLKVTGLDNSEEQINQAKKNLTLAGIEEDRYHLICADVLKENPLPINHFDSLLMVWVLEHVPKPVELLNAIKPNLMDNALIQITEVFHDSLNLEPTCDEIMSMWKATIKLQADMGMDANVGLKLGNILKDAEFTRVVVKPFPMQWDKSTPDKREEKLTYWEGLVHSGYVPLEERGIKNKLHWTKVKKEFESLRSNEDAVFYYSFIQGFAFK